MNNDKIGRLHVLTDFHFQQRYSHAEIASLALDGGADTIQLREKRVEIRHILRQADEVAEVCRRRMATLLINDRIDVALAAGADGVHLGQRDFPLDRAREILGSEAVIGATATTLEQAQRAADEGADYVGFGPVFETRSKANPASVKGVAVLRTVCREIGIPVIAIAGISEDSIEPVIDAGAYGVAVMTAVTTALDPAEAASKLREAINKALFH